MKEFDEKIARTISQVRIAVNQEIGLPQINMQVEQLFANALLPPDGINVQRLRKRLNVHSSDGRGVIFLMSPEKVTSRKNVPKEYRREILSYILTEEGRNYIESYEKTQSLYSRITPTLKLLAEQEAAMEYYKTHQYEFQTTSHS